MDDQNKVLPSLLVVQAEKTLREYLFTTCS